MSTFIRRHGWGIGGALVGLTLAGVFAGPIAAQVKAALVRDVDNPDSQELFSQRFDLEITPGNYTSEPGCVFNDSSGVRVVIEHVSAEAYATGGMRPYVVADLGKDDKLGLVIPFVSQGGATDTPSVLFLASQEVRLRFNEPLCFIAKDWGGANGSVLVSMFVDGYAVGSR